MSFPPTHGAKLSRRQWFLLLGLSVVVLCGFASAWLVTPDPRGFGTHQQFGLPPCTFRSLFGIPCPGCGGTTCVAHFVRGQWSSALRANATVFIMALCAACFLPWSWLSLRRGYCVAVDEPLSCLLTLLIALAVFAGLQWGYVVCFA
ncbi:DUF2752 domain-containing protein [Planctomicrobium sp. SH664]|uniref:DUF2752 domain-containing protein n=1 Tax=Planctomicrobium sp. SH664 TaxID=3448125 RepID=UPI003F5C5CD8